MCLILLRAGNGAQKTHCSYHGGAVFAAIAGQTVEGDLVSPQSWTTANFEMKAGRERPDTRSAVGAGHIRAPHGPCNFFDTLLDGKRAPNVGDRASLWRVTHLQLLHE